MHTFEIWSNSARLVAKIDIFWSHILISNVHNFVKKIMRSNCYHILYLIARRVVWAHLKGVDTQIK